VKLANQDANIIRRQQERIDELEETIRQMREAEKSSTTVLPAEWKLSPAQHRALVALYRAPAGFLTHEAMFQALRRSVGFDPANAANLVRKNVSDMRHRLAPFGIEIVLQWGRGYELTPASRAVVKTAIDQRTAA
jgi:DNA-binding response OmpR family regulator